MFSNIVQRKASVLYQPGKAQVQSLELSLQNQEVSQAQAKNTRAILSGLFRS